MLEIIRLPVLSDNYVWLVHEPLQKKTMVVDPAVPEPVLETLTERGWQLDHIFNTHHHWDHVGGNKALIEATGCTVIGPKGEAARIPGITRQVGDGDTVTLGAATARVFDVPGHTAGHIAYIFDDDKALFCGDTLFAMGCGRLFEGTAAEMWNSLLKLRDLPDDMIVHCAHEYTQANGRFALSVDQDNADLVRRMEQVRRDRERDIPTVPFALGIDKATNPFLRADNNALAAGVGLAGAQAVDVFAKTRQLKDQFKG